MNSLQGNKLAQEKYSAQVLLPEIGFAGQDKLVNSTVTIVGLGALGTTAAELLARAGIGSLKLIDADVVEQSNLQRQTLFDEKDVGKSKVRVAKKKLKRVNSLVKITTFNRFLTEKNLFLLDASDLVLDCTDNIEARVVVNRYCKLNRRPWIYAACIRTSGYVMPIIPDGPCLECFIKAAELESACTTGIINTIPVSIAALQATLAIKMLLGKKIEPFLYYYNVWKQQFRTIKVKKIC